MGGDLTPLTTSSIRHCMTCTCVIYNCERSERKIVLPIDFSHFLGHLRESSLEEGDGRIAPGILNPAVYTNSVYLLMLNKFSRRLRRGKIFISGGGGRIPPRRCLDETLAPNFGCLVRILPLAPKL